MTPMLCSRLLVLTCVLGSGCSLLFSGSDGDEDGNGAGDAGSAGDAGDGGGPTSCGPTNMPMNMPIGGEGDQRITATVVDGCSTYVCGAFTDQVLGEDAVGGDDVFVARVNHDGSEGWVQAFGNADNETCHDIAFGNVIGRRTVAIVGDYAGVLDELDLPIAQGRDGYVALYEADSGSFLAAAPMGANDPVPTADTLSAVAIADNRVLVGGFASGPAHFMDKTTATGGLVVGSIASSTTGQAVSFGGSASPEQRIRSIAASGSSLFVAGSFTGTLPDSNGISPCAPTAASEAGIVLHLNIGSLACSSYAMLDSDAEEVITDLAVTPTGVIAVGSTTSISELVEVEISGGSAFELQPPLMGGGVLIDLAAAAADFSAPAGTAEGTSAFSSFDRVTLRDGHAYVLASYSGTWRNFAPPALDMSTGKQDLAVFDYDLTNGSLDAIAQFGGMGSEEPGGIFTLDNRIFVSGHYDVSLTSNSSLVPGLELPPSEVDSFFAEAVYYD